MTADTATKQSIANLKLVGGHPVMDFVNTVHSRRRPDAGDYLNNFRDLLDLCVRIELLSPADAHKLKSGTPERAGRRVLAEAIELREAVYRLFHALASGASPADADVEVLNKACARTADLHRFRRRGGHLERVWEHDPQRPDGVLGPIAASAADLLQSDRVGRVKLCPPPDGCSWLFLDTSRNGSRTWCSMEDCGNAAKVRRFRRRARAGNSPT